MTSGTGIQFNIKNNMPTIMTPLIKPNNMPPKMFIQFSSNKAVIRLKIISNKRKNRMTPINIMTKLSIFESA